MSCGKKENYIEEQAWHVTANEACTGDLLGMIAEILVQMMQRRSTGLKLDDQDKEFLREILEEKDTKKKWWAPWPKRLHPKGNWKKQEEKRKA